MTIEKTKLMLMAKDMNRAVGFYKTALGLELLFQSPGCTEMLFGDAIVALLGGGNGDVNKTNINFQVGNIDEACHRARQRGAKIIQSPQDRHEERVYRAMIEDTEGNHVTLTQAMRTA